MRLAGELLEEFEHLIETITLVPSDEGRFEVIAYLTKSWDYGTFRFEVNGKPSEKEIDLYSGQQGRCVPSGAVSLGAFDLKKGNNQLSVYVPGKASGSPGYYFGIDGIVLKKGGRAEKL